MWRPAPLLCITAQVTERYSHKTTAFIIEEVNRSHFLNSNSHYFFIWLSGGILTIKSTPILTFHHSQYFPQELSIWFMIIFSRVKTMALTKCLLIGLCFLSFKQLRYSFCQVHHRAGFQVLSSPIQSRSYTGQELLPKGSVGCSLKPHCSNREFLNWLVTIVKMLSLNWRLWSTDQGANICFGSFVKHWYNSILNMHFSPFLFHRYAQKNNRTWSSLEDWKSCKSLYL